MEDKSGIKPNQKYRCKDRDCYRVSYGHDLVAIKRRRLEEVNGDIVEVGPFYVCARKCPYCRAAVTEL